jgi:triosephosphate isomerase
MNNPLPLVVANLKANLTWDEVSQWISKVGPLSQKFKGTIVLCPSYPFLTQALWQIKSSSFNIELGSQDVSKFESGAYTGEVSASQLAGICQFAIVGHSERKKYFQETDSDITKKVSLLLKNNLKPLLCINAINQLEAFLKESTEIKQKASEIIFVYEPPGAISGGGEYKPEEPQVAAANAKKIQEIIGTQVTTIYGGSINPQNAQSLFSIDSLNGGLIGQASVDPLTFCQILEIVK